MKNFFLRYQTADDLIEEDNFLKVAERAEEVGTGEIVDIDFDDALVEFDIQGMTDIYQCYVKILDLIDIEPSYTIEELTDIIEGSDLEVACTCPAFLYWGFQYVTGEELAGLWEVPEFPKVRNPLLKGGGCKHLHRILSDWHYWAEQIAIEYDEYLNFLGPVLLPPPVEEIEGGEEAAEDGGADAEDPEFQNYTRTKLNKIKKKFNN